MGVTGFTVLDGQPVVDSLFLSMEMYFLNYSDSPPNILIEIARWTAPLMTASGVLMSISKIRGRILQLLRYYRGDSIAVYGDNIHRKEMVQALGSCGIDAGEDWEWVKAKKYLILGNEDENFRFYGQHREAFAGHTVYLKSENLAAEGILDPHLRLFCPEETAARLYWRRNCLYETSCAHGHRLQIVFLGFELLGEKLLESADRILLLPQKGQLGMAGKLLASTTGTAFEVFTVEDDGFELLSGRSACTGMGKRSMEPGQRTGNRDIRACKEIESSLCTSVRRCGGKFRKYGTGMGKTGQIYQIFQCQCSRLS